MKKTRGKKEVDWWKKMVFDPYGIIQLKILFYFVGIVIGWFVFYFLIDALKKIEAFTKKKTAWKLIYISLPFLLIEPIAELHSYYVLGEPLGGTEGIIAAAFFALSSALLLTAVFEFKRHLDVKMMMPSVMAVAFFVFITYNVALLARILDFNAFTSTLLYSIAFFFLALSLWIVGSYTKEFHTLYPMPVFLIASSLLLLVGQIVNSYALANHYADLEVFTTLDFAGSIFVFLGLMVAAISTYVFKKTVIEFTLHTSAGSLKGGGEENQIRV